jgi:hypothetical protein
MGLTIIQTFNNILPHSPGMSSGRFFHEASCNDNKKHEC